MYKHTLLGINHLYHTGIGLQSLALRHDLLILLTMSI